MRRATVQNVTSIEKKCGQRINSKLISVSRLMAWLKEMGVRGRSSGKEGKEEGGERKVQRPAGERVVTPRQHRTRRMAGVKEPQGPGQRSVPGPHRELRGGRAECCSPSPSSASYVPEDVVQERGGLGEGTPTALGKAGEPESRSMPWGGGWVGAGSPGD